MSYEYTRENDLRYCEATLIKRVKVIDENGVPQFNDDDRLDVLAKLGGVYEKEFYDAYQSGIKPQYKLVVFYGDYDGQTVVELDDGNKYSVYRRYQSGDDMELYLRDDTGQWE